MKSGYKVLWTDHALNELEKTIEYLEINFSEKELKRLAEKIESVTELISQNPKLFPKSDKEEVYREQFLNSTQCIIAYMIILLKFYHFFPIAKILKNEKYKNFVQIGFV